ncbi:hypothetical protein D917_08297, partial [Trichinella nativa]
AYAVHCRADRLFPCERGGVVVGARTPSHCPAASTLYRVRLFAVRDRRHRPMEVGRRGVYVAERALAAADAVVEFQCALFDLIYPEYCFRLVSVHGDGLVRHLAQRCVPTERNSRDRRIQICSGPGLGIPLGMGGSGTRARGQTKAVNLHIQYTTHLAIRHETVAALKWQADYCTRKINDRCRLDPLIRFGKNPNGSLNLYMTGPRVAGLHERRSGQTWICLFSKRNPIPLQFIYIHHCPIVPLRHVHRWTVVGMAVVEFLYGYVRRAFGEASLAALQQSQTRIRWPILQRLGSGDRSVSPSAVSR